jgi:hypothetical protein
VNTSLYCVRCQSSAGRVHDSYVRAASENGAIREALRTLNAANPREGWLPVWALAQ